MKFISLKLVYENQTKIFKFSSGFNQISSSDNSVGKSTLLRLLFYAMGYPIPQTKGIRFSKVSSELSLSTGDGIMTIYRNDKEVQLKTTDNEYLFYLPNDELKLHSILYGSSNSDVLNNILGSIYVDQEKGWTLINNGDVIGKIRFSLQELVSGLAERTIDELHQELSSVENELRKYKSMKDVYDYKTNILEEKNVLTSSEDDYIDELEQEINILEIEFNEYGEQIKQIRSLLRDNREFLKYISDMKISIKDSVGNIVKVTKENIINFNDNQQMLKSKEKILTLRKAKVESSIKKMRQEIKNSVSLVDVQTEIEKFDSQISNIKINYNSLETIIEQLTKKRNKLSKEIDRIAKSNNNIVDDMYFIVRNYAEELGISKYIEENRDYLFTKKLVIYSGAIYHKIAFVFKMAYIKSIEKYLNIKLPIVLDSPSGREVNKTNVNEMMKIIDRDFKDNQVIIASIYEYELRNVNMIKLNKRIFE